MLSKILKRTSKFLNNKLKDQKNFYTLLDLSVSSLRRGHANLLCIVPILADDLKEVPNL